MSQTSFHFFFILFRSPEQIVVMNEIKNLLVTKPDSILCKASKAFNQIYRAYHCYTPYKQETFEMEYSQACDLAIAIAKEICDATNSFERLYVSIIMLWVTLLLHDTPRVVFWRYHCWTALDESMKPDYWGFVKAVDDLLLCVIDRTDLTLCDALSFLTFKLSRSQGEAHMLARLLEAAGLDPNLAHSKSPAPVVGSHGSVYDDTLYSTRLVLLTLMVASTPAEKQLVIRWIYDTSVYAGEAGGRIATLLPVLYCGKCIRKAWKWAEVVMAQLLCEACAKEYDGMRVKLGFREFSSYPQLGEPYR